VVEGLKSAIAEPIIRTKKSYSKNIFKKPLSSWTRILNNQVIKFKVL